jgi:hypothetical protein
MHGGAGAVSQRRPHGEEEGSTEVREDEALPTRSPSDGDECPWTDGARVEEVGRICNRGERGGIFSSPLSCDAKCLPSMPALLESKMMIHSILEEV